MSKTIPNSDVLATRDAMKADKICYLQSRLLWEKNIIIIQARRNEKNSGGGGGVRIMKYCRPPWLPDKENFAFQIV